jgi:DNA polymerase-3 subunit epsilon
VAAAVSRWVDLPEHDARRPATAGRWVVVDVESSGLDPLQDRLIAIGALAVVDGVVDLADSFEVVLRQAEASSTTNIEVHGIGGTEQREGEESPWALADFLTFIGKDPLVAFHAPFDEALLQRAIRTHLGVSFKRPWLDLADLAPLAWPGDARQARRGLDGWLARCSIPFAHRHRAIADCLATAQLLLCIQPELPRLGARTAKDLLGLVGKGRWLA